MKPPAGGKRLALPRCSYGDLGGCVGALREVLFLPTSPSGPSLERDPAIERLIHGGAARDEPLSVDDCLNRAGGWGPYQRRLMRTLGACTAACAVHMLQPIFLAPLLDWDLSLVQRGIVSSAFFGGYCVGVLIWAWVSDRRGRRPTIILSRSQLV